MDTATKNLGNDHVHILRLIDVMEKMIILKSMNIDHFETVVNLIKNYADGFHHAKEENLFFLLLSERGFSIQQGPVAVMLNEHVQGRNYVKGMSEGIVLLKEGKDLSGQKNNADFWIQMKGHFIHIRYFALRNVLGEYKGMIEVSQDVTEIRSLKGEPRLLEWNN